MRIFPENQPRQVLRLRRLMMAMASYAMWVLLGLFAYRAGLLPISNTMVTAIISGIIITNAFFFALIRSGVNERFNDPSMTLFQCAVALCWALVLMFSTAEARGLMMSVYVVTVLFGTFQLNKKEFLALSIFAFAGYLSVVAVEYNLYPDRFSGALEIMRISVLASVLLWTSMFGLYVGRLKFKLKEKNTELERVVEEVSRLAERDDLTKAYNRRFIMDCLRTEEARAMRSGTPFSVCIFDIDHFKTINDRFGHLAGDRVLTAFSERARGTIRAMDLIGGTEGGRSFGRYGGEEFIVILPSTTLDGARRCAERVRLATADEPFDDVFEITLSAGVSEFRLGDNIEDTLRRADNALYLAKQNGRNQVQCQQSVKQSSDDGDSRRMPNIVLGHFGKGLT
ncbi:MAG: GGDEF domain-containing protein [Gammaproteobacteria bacterium]